VQRVIRKIFPLSATIPPGQRTIVTATPKEPFRIDRLTISPQSFPVPALRKLWTWPLVHTGAALGRAHRALARLLRVDLYASHERRDPVGDEEEGDDIFEDYDGPECTRYRVVAIPLNRRERLLGPLGSTARRLADVRLRWQNAHLAHVTILDITIGKLPQLSATGTLPGDLFTTNTIAGLVPLDPCTAGHAITIEIENGSRRECQLTAALIGTGPSA
jgi:hypothetical protein